jgi:hypothetical protein
MELPDIVKLSALLFSDSNNQCVCWVDTRCSEEDPCLIFAACRLRRNSLIHSITKLSLMTTDKKILEDIKTVQTAVSL